jgi:hypothetical protein
VNRGTRIAAATKILLLAVIWDCSAFAYDGEGAKYVSPDRTEQYVFLAKIAEYQYVYPHKRIGGQIFPPDQSDQVPNAATGDCSDPAFRCVNYDYQAFAVPKKGLTPNDHYVAAGNFFEVVQCVRENGNVCQVALIRDKCYYINKLGTCDPVEANSEERQTPWLMYFFYNDDFGVTSFGIAPSRPDDAPVETVSAFAKKYVLVRDNGLLKP